MSKLTKLQELAALQMDVALEMLDAFEPVGWVTRLPGPPPIGRPRPTVPLIAKVAFAYLKDEQRYWAIADDDRGTIGRGSIGFAVVVAPFAEVTRAALEQELTQAIGFFHVDTSLAYALRDLQLQRLEEARLRETAVRRAGSGPLAPTGPESMGEILARLMRNREHVDSPLGDGFAQTWMEQIRRVHEALVQEGRPVDPEGFRERLERLERLRNEQAERAHREMSSRLAERSISQMSDMIRMLGPALEPAARDTARAQARRMFEERGLPIPAVLEPEESEPKKEEP